MFQFFEYLKKKKIFAYFNKNLELLPQIFTNPEMSYQGFSLYEGNATPTLYSLLSTLYSLLSTLYSLISTLYSLLSTLYSILATLYSLLSTLYSII